MGLNREPPLQRWKRRSITIPLYVLLFVLLGFLLPITCTVAAVYDLFKRNRWSTLRAVVFLEYYFAFEIFGVFMMFIYWILWRVRPDVSEAEFIDWNTRLQWYWGRTLFLGAISIFDGKLEIEEDYSFSGRPILFFIRHASMADTLLASYLISSKHHVRLCYIVKKELLWDPCIDINGNRTPVLFVDRLSGDRRQIEKLGRIARHLGPGEGVLIYPEGTRFTRQKQSYLLKKFRERGDDEAYSQTLVLTHVLPPRKGGPLALLNRNAGADAVFCAHTGLEKTVSFRELLNGGLVGATCRIRIWGVPFEQIPQDRHAQMDWLHEQWRAVNNFVAKHSESTSL